MNPLIRGSLYALLFASPFWAAVVVVIVVAVNS